MSEPVIINLMMFLFGAGVFGILWNTNLRDIFTRRTKGLDSFDIITILVLSERKSGRTP